MINRILNASFDLSSLSGRFRKPLLAFLWNKIMNSRSIEDEKAVLWAVITFYALLACLDRISI